MRHATSARREHRCRLLQAERHRWIAADVARSDAVVDDKVEIDGSREKLRR
jgi:hypothetical protein